MATRRQSRVGIDFFGIGGAKCGSRWLAKCLDEHPAVAIVAGKRVKETAVRSPLVVAFERPGGRFRGAPADAPAKLSRHVGFSRAVRLAGTQARPCPANAAAGPRTTQAHLGRRYRFARQFAGPATERLGGMTARFGLTVGIRPGWNLRTGEEMKQPRQGISEPY